MIDEKHLREIVEQHAFEHKGISYRLSLPRVLPDPRFPVSGREPIAADVWFVATPGGGGADVALHLHLGIYNVRDDNFVLAQMDEGFRDILNGELPPGAVKYL